jgi:hypothetical protein
MQQSENPGPALNRARAIRWRPLAHDRPGGGSGRGNRRPHLFASGRDQGRAGEKGRTCATSTYTALPAFAGCMASAHEAAGHYVGYAQSFLRAPAPVEGANPLKLAGPAYHGTRQAAWRAKPSCCPLLRPLHIPASSDSPLKCSVLRFLRVLSTAFTRGRLPRVSSAAWPGYGEPAGSPCPGLCGGRHIA